MFRRFLRILLLAVLSLPVAATLAAAPYFSHPGLQYNPRQLADARQASARAPVIALADSLAGEASDAMAVFDVPGYFIDPATQQARVKLLQADVRAAYVSALAFQLTGRTAYADTAKRLVLSWVDRNTSVTGYDGSIVMTYLGVGFLAAADLTWDRFSSAELARLREWTHAVYFLQAANPEQTRHANNHRTWGIYGALAAAYIRHDAALLAREVAEWKAHVTATVQGDGSLPLEIARGSSAGWYTYFALAPMLAGAQTIQNATGERLWDFNGGALERALGYLYRQYANPDRLGAGSSCNPENLFEAVKEVYPSGPWVAARYPAAGTVIDASSDQHVAWEFPTLLKATRTFDATPAPSDGEAAPAPSTLAVQWRDGETEARFCSVEQVEGQTFVEVHDGSKVASAFLDSDTVAITTGRTYALAFSARRRSGATMVVEFVARDRSGRTVRSVEVRPHLGNWTSYRLRLTAPDSAESLAVVLSSDVKTVGCTEITAISLQPE